MTIKKIQPFHIDNTKDFVFGNLNTDATFQANSVVNLGSVANVHITGGTNGQYLITDGTGNLSFTTLSVSSSSISNGNSNVNIPSANGNVTISSAGNANIVVVTGTGVNVAGTLNVTGNANVGNLGATGVYATTLDGTLTTQAQPNITSVGTLSSLTVTGNISSGNANLGNLATANYFTGTLTTGAQPNITSTGTLTSLTVTGNISSGNANLGNLITANYTTAVLTTGAQPNITSLGTLSNLTSNGTVNFTNASNVSLGAVGNVKITGGSNGQYLKTDGSGTLSWAAVATGSQPGTDFNTSIDTVNNYAVTNTMANGAVFGSNVIVYSMYVTNIDTTGSNGAAISANLRYANGTGVILVNQIPVPYRGAVELLKQPKYFANGDAIQLQAFNNGTAANSFFHASITYQTTTDTTYQYAVTNISSANTATDVYTSSSNASVVQSVMLTNSSNLGNIAVTTSIVNSSNVVQGYLSYTLLIPINSTIELCEQPRRMASGDKIQVTTGGANTITVTVAAKKI